MRQQTPDGFPPDLRDVRKYMHIPRTLSRGKREGASRRSHHAREGPQYLSTGRSGRQGHTPCSPPLHWRPLYDPAGGVPKNSIHQHPQVQLRHAPQHALPPARGTWDHHQLTRPRSKLDRP